MANLVSPGVSVSVIDESFYTPAEPGTTPMVFVATAQDKANASGTGTARGTTKANAGVILLTPQRDLSTHPEILILYGFKQQSNTRWRIKRIWSTSGLFIFRR